jgi:hypothetical protein
MFDAIIFSFIQNMLKTLKYFQLFWQSQQHGVFMKQGSIKWNPFFMNKEDDNKIEVTHLKSSIWNININVPFLAQLSKR